MLHSTAYVSVGNLEISYALEEKILTFYSTTFVWHTVPVEQRKMSNNWDSDSAPLRLTSSVIK